MLPDRGELPIVGQEHRHVVQVDKLIFICPIITRQDHFAVVQRFAEEPAEETSIEDVVRHQQEERLIYLATAG